MYVVMSVIKRFVLNNLKYAQLFDRVTSYDICWYIDIKQTTKYHLIGLPHEIANKNMRLNPKNIDQYLSWVNLLTAVALIFLIPGEEI